MSEDQQNPWVHLDDAVEAMPDGWYALFSSDGEGDNWVDAVEAKSGALVKPYRLMIFRSRQVFQTEAAARDWGSSADEPSY